MQLPHPVLISMLVMLLPHVPSKSQTNYGSRVGLDSFFFTTHTHQPEGAGSIGIACFMSSREPIIFFRISLPFKVGYDFIIPVSCYLQQKNIEHYNDVKLHSTKTSVSRRVLHQWKAQNKQLINFTVGMKR